MAKDEKKNKKRKRKAALALLRAFRKTLKTLCGKYDNVKDWQSMIKEKLHPILDEYEDHIPVKVRKALEKAAEVDETTEDGIQKACKALDSELGKAINALSPSLLATVLKAAFIGGVVVIGGGIIALNATQATITVRNIGCGTLEAPVELPTRIPGIELPSEPLVDGGSVEVKLPPISLNVTADESGIYVGKSGSGTFGSSLGLVKDVTFDGQSLLQGTTKLDFKARGQHELVISCG